MFIVNPDDSVCIASNTIKNLSATSNYMYICDNITITVTPYEYENAEAGSPRQMPVASSDDQPIPSGVARQIYIMNTTMRYRLAMIFTLTFGGFAILTIFSLAIGIPDLVTSDSMYEHQHAPAISYNMTD